MIELDADKVPEGLYRVFWNDGHQSSIGIVIGTAGISRRRARPLLTERAVNKGTYTWDTSVPWSRVERIEQIGICDTPNQCAVRKNLINLSTTATKRLALADKIGETALPTIRDLFLEGRDEEALGVLTNELGMVQLASRGAQFRQLTIGDPVVVVAYGRITETSSGHGRCYHVGLFSEGLGYGTANSTDPRGVWLEPDELRYSYPPMDVLGRVPSAEHALAYAARTFSEPPSRLKRALEAFESLSDGERMSIMQQCCTGCGVLYSEHTCDCAKTAMEDVLDVIR